LSPGRRSNCRRSKSGHSASAPRRSGNQKLTKRRRPEPWCIFAKSGFKTLSPGHETLYSFCAQSGCTDGANPIAPLVQATNANLYGTMYYGGAYGEGTVFKITAGGALTTLHSFCAQGPRRRARDRGSVPVPWSGRLARSSSTANRGWISHASCTFALRLSPGHGMNGEAMTPYPILFNQSPDQLRRIGARGGRANARNWRARQQAPLAAGLPVRLPAIPPMETTAQAVAALNLRPPVQRCWRAGP